MQPIENETEILQRLLELEGKIKVVYAILNRTWVRRKEAMSLTNLSNDTLAKYANDNTHFVSGKIRRVYEGAKPLFLLADIEAFLISKKRLTPQQCTNIFLNHFEKHETFS